VKQKFEEFLKSSWGLELWLGDKLACPPKLGELRRGIPIFRSKKSGVRGLLDFINERREPCRNLVVFDKIVGRGAALLAAYLKAKERVEAIIKKKVDHQKK